MDITDGKPAPYITWSTRQVISWLQGLDDVLEPCLPELEAKGVNGKWLNSVTPGELCRLGVTKVGHQMIIMDKIRQLQAQYAAFDNETMQIVLFRVSRCCVRITAAVNALMSITERQDSRDPDSDSVYPGILDDIQDALSYVLNCVLALMLAVMNAGFWLERPPFLLLPDMNTFRQLIIEGALVANRQAQLAISTQIIGHYKDMLVFVESIRVRVEEVIQNFSDSIMLTPCGMELVQIRKVDNAEFGFNFRSTLNNVHVIVSVQNDSPAFCSGKVSKGDEVIEVNDQVVIGWQHRRVADLMRTHPKRITLRLRKRPAHTIDFPGFLGGGRRHRVVAPQNPTAGTLPQFTRAGNLFARTPKRRTPLQPPNEASLMNGTSESADSALALSPTTNSIPEAPIYSPSSSSSSSRCASMKLNDLQHVDPGLLDPSDSVTQNTTFTSHSLPAIRMISSTPSTPLMAVRMNHREPSGERIINLSNSQGPASPVETPGLKIVYEPSSLRVASASSTPNKSILPRFHGTHRRTASGDPTLLTFSTPVTKEQDPDSSKASVSPNSSKVQALDKRCRFIRGSMEDIARLGKFVFGSKRSARRISCKELGKGDWQGWLWLKKSNPLASKYVKRWCVFKNATLYYYRNLEDDCAEGVINVHGFTITPGPTEIKSGRL
ncbi:hypothetical protein PHET_07354 [Paragonimus heterotremus]|uniref:Connector enhancer of kinase suppressor of ras 2 n=1 Tax=Paragonimus heterotremus TaxID=100268 RepID=A0A8J4T9J7_9TREM|nr:hypothetical protein PHET_07354 [Paragonimus heterotremus]